MSFTDRISSLFPSKDELDLTEGSVKKTLFFLALPLVITQLLQTAYNLADTIWIGQYGTDSLAAISFAFPLVFLLISLGIGMSIAGSVLVAQRMGAGEDERARLAASQALFYTLSASVVLGIIGYFSVHYVIEFFGASQSVLPLATDYMEIISLGLPTLFGFTIFSALSRGNGDTVTPMLLMGGTVILNILLDPILIFGFTSNPLFEVTNTIGIQNTLFQFTGYTGDGLRGAAYATVGSRLLALIIGIYILFFSDRSITVSLHQMKPNLEELKNLIRVGVPSSIEMIGRAISVNLMLLVVGLFPTAIVAGFGVGVRIFSVVFLPAIAVSQAVETISGQSYGSNKPERLKETNNFAMKALFISLSLLGVIVWIYAEPIASIFTNDPQVKNIAKLFMRIVAPTFGFTGIMRAYSGGLRGVGKTEISAIVGITTLAVVRLPLAYWLSRIYGADGIWYAFAVSNVLGAILGFTFFVYILKILEL